MEYILIKYKSNCKEAIGDKTMSKLLPKEYCESIYKINYQRLKKNNIKCLLFDLDNTCVPYIEKNPSEELASLFNKLKKMGFRVIIFTNATKKRTIPFKKLDVECNYFSRKPLKASFNKIIKKHSYQKKEVCIIGDQLFTDIYGGNKVGIHTILVEPLSKEDLIFTKILRFLEANIIKYYNKKGLFIKGE